MNDFAYIALIIAGLLFAVLFLLSMGKRIGFAKKWKPLATSIAIMNVIFLIIELIFLGVNVWWFNNDYISGIFVFKNIPIERLLSFIIIPICCVLVYEYLKYEIPKLKLQALSFWITIILGSTTLYLAAVNADRLYTFVFMIFASTIVFWQIFYGNHKTWLTHFYLMLLIALIPFTIVNGVHTSLPIVIFSEQEIMNVKFCTIPAEDFIYFLVMVFMVVMLYEPLKQHN